MSAVIEVAPQMEGRTMLVVMAPSKSVVKKKEKGEQPKADAKRKRKPNRKSGKSQRC